MPAPKKTYRLRISVFRSIGLVILKWKKRPIFLIQQSGSFSWSCQYRFSPNPGLRSQNTLKRSASIQYFPAFYLLYTPRTHMKLSFEWCIAFENLNIMKKVIGQKRFNPGGIKSFWPRIKSFEANNFCYNVQIFKCNTSFDVEYYRAQHYLSHQQLKTNIHIRNSNTPVKTRFFIFTKKQNHPGLNRF